MYRHKDDKNQGSMGCDSSELLPGCNSHMFIICDRKRLRIQRAVSDLPYKII